MLLNHSLAAQSFKVLVLDALSGKPQSGVMVHYFCQSAVHNFLPTDSDITNPDGIAIVDYMCRPDQHMEMDVTALPKDQCGEMPSLTFNEISSAGIIVAPDGDGEMQCPTKVSRKLKPIPGEVILFIKKPNWWQYHFR